MKNDICKHYRASYVYQTCLAGVNYRQAFGDGRGLNARLACLTLNDFTCKTPCEKREFPTAAEVAERERQVQERHQLSSDAYALCSKDAIAHGFVRGGRGSIGKVECPQCHGVLQYTIAGSNGHISAKCQTKGCLCWMQ
jgi:hypothetical protein